MKQVLAQQILDIVYADPHIRRTHKDCIADWILDTQPRSAPLSASALVRYLSEHQADLLERLRRMGALGEDLGLRGWRPAASPAGRETDQARTNATAGRHASAIMRFLRGGRSGSGTLTLPEPRVQMPTPVQNRRRGGNRPRRSIGHGIAVLVVLFGLVCLAVRLAVAAADFPAAVPNCDDPAARAHYHALEMGQIVGNPDFPVLPPNIAGEAASEPPASNRYPER